MFRKFGLGVLLCSLAMGINGIVVRSSSAQQQMPQSAQNVTNGSTALVEQGSYENREGYVVHRPAHTVSGAVPAGASAQCRDGSHSFSMNHRGTCSRHGGVLRWL